MPSSSTSTASYAASNFANLLATLSEPEQKEASGWEDSELADDVATLSYEDALQDSAAYATQPPVSRETPVPQPGSNPAASAESERKDASITIRLSKAECAQVHQRAAEAGLTVSAYLRSCTLEAESLREMVKTTLAQLRLATNQVKPVTPAAPVSSTDPIAAAPAPPRSSRLHRFAGCLGSIFTAA